MKIFKVLAITACVFLASCSWFDQKKEANYIQYMKMLPEIEEADRDIKEATDNKSGISFLEGETEGDFVYFSAGYSGADKFETYYRIRISAEKKVMEMEDLATGNWKTVLQNWE